MANRTFIDKSYSLAKGEVRLYAAFTAAELASPTLLKWNYPQMGAGTTAPGRTYTAAPTTGGTGALGHNYGIGAEGVATVARTAVGLWTVTLQDAYQRLLDLHGFVSVAGGSTNVVAIHENTSVSNMSTGTPPVSVIGVSFLSASGTLVDPTTAARVQLCFTLQTLTAP